MRIFYSLLFLFLSYHISAQEVTMLNLINADDNTVVHELIDGDTVYLNSTPNFSIQAEAINEGSVVFNLTGNAAHNRTESAAPYALFGDNAGDYNAWSNPQPGTYNLAVTPYDQSGGGGTAGAVYQVAFVIAGGGNGGSACTPSFFKILHYTETSGFDHTTRVNSLAMFEQLGLQYNFEVVNDNTGSFFDTLAHLQQYAVVVFSNTSGDAILSATQRANFEAYINNGGSYLGIHAASDTYRHSTANGNNTGTWDWYSEMLGASVQQGPNHVQGTPSYAMTKTNPHPSTDSLPNPWQKNEEYYYWEGGYYNTDNVDVLEVEETVGPNGLVNSYDVPRPMSWYKELTGGGRSFYTALGHGNNNFTSDANFRAHIRDALLWCAGSTLICDISIQVKAYLGGTFDPGTGLLKDDLRTAGHIPLTEPHSGIFTHYAPGGGEVIDTSVLLVTGSNAIVDWVFVELRDKTDSTVIVATRSALIQADGDVVDLDGSSDLSFTGVNADDYYVVIRHVNHFGVMSASPVALSSSPVSIDFTDPGTPTWGTNARATSGGTMLMWSGNVYLDDTIKYSGIDNDRDPILIKIGGTVPTNVVFGYHAEDINRDGHVKYSGVDNDRDIILMNIGGVVPTNTIQEQLPE